LFDHVFHDFITLFVVFNPTGIVPNYLYFTRNVPPEARRRLAIRCVLIASAILVGFIFLGQFLLEALGIGLPAFDIAGGVVLLVISVRMIFEDVEETAGENKEAEKWTPDSYKKLAVFPLATPLIAGPGAILVVVVLADNHRFTHLEIAETTLVMLVIMVFTCFVLMASQSIQRVLGITGINMMSRVYGIILAALAVETILDGVTDRFFA
jgi:multiple antibiotic resistance protein